LFWNKPSIWGHFQCMVYQKINYSYFRWKCDVYIAIVLLGQVVHVEKNMKKVAAPVQYWEIVCDPWHIFFSFYIYIFPEKGYQGDNLFKYRLLLSESFICRRSLHHSISIGIYWFEGKFWNVTGKMEKQRCFDNPSI
jgi:hypothetical protein